MAGLIGPGERKSVQPVAERLGPPSDAALHHFIAAGVWNSEPPQAALVRDAARLVGGRGASLIVDDTALPQKGTRSVGVAPQYASVLGKTANCQTLVSLTLARGEVPVPFALRPFLPEDWMRDSARLERAGVPGVWRTPRSTPEVAIAEINHAVAAEMRFRPLLAHAGDGISATFRAGLSTRGLRWAVGVPRILKVYPADVNSAPYTRGGSAQAARASPPLAPGRGGPRKSHVAEGDLAARQKGRLSAHFAAARVRVADDPAQQADSRPAQHPPGEAAWVVGERRASGRTKYYLTNLPPDTALTTLAATIKARWACEQAHRQMREDLGLDHFEGRSWTGCTDTRS